MSFSSYVKDQYEKTVIAPFGSILPTPASGFFRLLSKTWYLISSAAKKNTMGKEKSATRLKITRLTLVLAHERGVLHQVDFILQKEVDLGERTIPVSVPEW